MGRRKINRGLARRQELRDRAEVLSEERSKRTPQQQLSILDERLGKDVGAVRERQRLQYLIDNPPRPKKEKKNGRPSK